MMKIFKSTKKNMKDNVFSLAEVIVFIFVTALVTSLGSGLIVYTNLKEDKVTLVRELTDDKYLQEFITSYASVVDDYYKDVNRSELINVAINSMFDYLGDPYTTYLSEEQTQSLMDELSGEYNGIGIKITLNKNNQVLIDEVFESSPAKEAGLKKGDIITIINKQEMDNKSLSEAVELIKNKKDVILSVMRDNQELEFTIKIKKLDIPSVNHEVIQKNKKKVGYINISIFSQTTAKQLSEALKVIAKENIDSLIIDVRNNAGGYLSSAYDSAELFLKKGKIVYQLKEKDKTSEYLDETNESLSYNIIVMQNKQTASAAEILTAALKESYGASILGTNSFGKGKVQKTTSLTDGSMVKYTTSKWLTPTGTCIDGDGIKPDYIVENDEDSDIDNQLNKAIELLTK